MKEYYSLQRKVFLIVLGIFFGIICLASLIPFIHVLALSFSHKIPAMQGAVILWPLNFNTETKDIFVGLNLKSYEFVLKKPEFVIAFYISILRIVLGASINMLMVIMTAYPLSKNKNELKGRTAYAWFFMFTMLFSGGLIPWYMVISNTGLLNTIWALVIPGAVPVFNVVLLLNFYRGIPKSLEESAFIDGAGHWRILWQIYVPLATPALATILLFTVVGHWNAWFDGLILMKSPKNYPLQSYMQTLIMTTSQALFTRATAELLKNISDKTVKAAQIFIAAVPMLLLYPFLQRYFMVGIVLGSVKE